MITSIEAMNFRSLKYIACKMDRFHILVGPNASGKSTFLGVLTFIQDFLRNGLEEAISPYVDFRNLLFCKSGKAFELAIEAKIPEDKQEMLREKKAGSFSHIRYQIRIGYPEAVIVDDATPWSVLAENVFLVGEAPKETVNEQLSAFPYELTPPPTILLRGRKRWMKLVISRDGEQSRYYSEVSEEKGKGWFPVIRIHPQRIAMNNVPLDEKNLPVTSWFRELLINDLQSLVLNSFFIRQSSAPGSNTSYKPDGSNLPWVVKDLRDNNPERYRMWIKHLRTVLTDLDDINVNIREDIRHAILSLRYSTGVSLPSWMISDGTLRMIALTLIAYLPKKQGIYLIEEPENGIHPTAVEAVFQSLSSVYDAQVLLASHSPVILSQARLDQILCFRKNADGSTCIAAGDQRPDLGDWQDSADIATLLANGVL